MLTLSGYMDGRAKMQHQFNFVALALRLLAFFNIDRTLDETFDYRLTSIDVARER